MKVLVAYASRHGATAGIAERIAERLRDTGLLAEARPIEEVGDVGGYDAVVIGAAAYMFHWLKDATRFVRRHRDELRSRPVWLFSSGPLGTDLVDEEGRDILEVTRPKEFDELHALIAPRGERVFFGAWDPDAPPVGFGERLLRRMPAARDATPAGDFRDWSAIEAWAAEIASELHGAETTGAQRG
jgi:menaquinone-dependent protoporphyrinogen oxidase